MKCSCGPNEGCTNCPIDTCPKCKQKMTVSSGDEGTSCYVCLECEEKKACDECGRGKCLDWNKAGEHGGCGASLGQCCGGHAQSPKSIYVARCVCGEDVLSDDGKMSEDCSCGRSICADLFEKKEVANVTKETIGSEQTCEITSTASPGDKAMYVQICNCGVSCPVHTQETSAIDHKAEYIKNIVAQAVRGNWFSKIVEGEGEVIDNIEKALCELMTVMTASRDQDLKRAVRAYANDVHRILRTSSSGSDEISYAIESAARKYLG